MYRAALAAVLFVACGARLQVLRPGLAGTHGALVLPDGGVWLADSFGRRSPERALWDWSAEPRRIAAPALPPLAGLAWTPDGGVLACAFDDGAVLLLDSAQAVLQRWPVPQAWNAVWTPQGPWAVSGAGAVHRLHADGGTEPALTGLDAPFDLAPVDGGLWVSEQVADPALPGRVTFFADDGRRVPARYPFRNPEGLAVVPPDRVLVADTERRELVLIDATGAAQLVAIVDGLPVVVRRNGNAFVVAVTGPRSALVEVRLP